MNLMAIARSVTPQWIKVHLRTVRRGARYRRHLKQWHSAREVVRPVLAGDKLERVLIIACDPYSVVGSLGDDAMLSSAIGAAQAINQRVEIHTITEGEASNLKAREKLLISHEIWSKDDFYLAVAELANEIKFDAAFLIGADVMDGYYDLFSTIKLLGAIDLVSHSGVPASILGFSFNNSPAPELRQVFDQLSTGVKINLRDSISLDRFRRFSDAPARLVADSAFSLKAQEPDSEMSSWVKQQHVSGRSVIGVNLHPMLLRNATEYQIKETINYTIDALLWVSKMHSVAWCLLPHDYRPLIGDGICLKPILENICSELGDRVFYLDGEHTAAELKGSVGILDGAFSARMHLAIAAIGKGVPAMCVTYQGKFDGMFRHFGLPGRLLMSPDELVEPGKLRSNLVDFLSELDDVRELIRSKQVEVASLSALNFDILEQFGRHTAKEKSETL